MDFDWSKFEHLIHIKSDVDTIFNQISTPSGFRKWFTQNCYFLNLDEEKLERSEELKEGYLIRWRHFDSEEWGESKVLRVVPKRIVKILFESKSVEVTYTVSNSKDGYSLLSLAQEGMPTDEKGKIAWHMSCRLGWSFFLTNLKSRLEGGIDLRGPSKEFDFDPGRIPGFF